MPREQITFAKIPVVRSPLPGDPVRELTPATEMDPELHVSWMPSRTGFGHVQVALECDTEWADRLLADNDDERAFIYAPVMSRDDINKMIRVLRRARDAAYGSDA